MHPSPTVQPASARSIDARRATVAPSPVAVSRTKGPRRPGLGLVLAVYALLAGLTVGGGAYYFVDRASRVRHPWHEWLRPSGWVGQTAGILALAIFVFLWLYPLRKKVRWLSWTGSMAAWLDVHVAAALLLPVLGAVHAAWRFEGLIGLGFWSMMIVCASGVVGRFLYVRIPRRANGIEMTVDEITAERRTLLAQLADDTGLPLAQIDALLRADPTPCVGLGIWATARRMLKDEVQRWRAARALKALCRRRRIAGLDRGAVRRIVRLATHEMALSQQLRMLEATHRIFRLWHVAHRPFAITALVAVLVHVAVVVAMGMTWFW